LDIRTFTELLDGKQPDLDTIARALDLYRGDFLEGFHLRDARGFAERICPSGTAACRRCSSIPGAF
jgi:hypothetical protein